MICFVDMEHEHAAERGAPCPEAAGSLAHHEAYVADVRARLEETSGDRCEVRRYDEVSTGWVESGEVRALILSGNVAPWKSYDPHTLEPVKAIIRNAALPILGLCGGLQFIAMAHGAQVGPLRRLEDAEDDPAPHYGPGYLKEWGYLPLRILQTDPLFAGLREPAFLQAHYWEVQEVPEGFVVLASTDVCRVQVLRRVDRPVYGTQFHPEAYVLEPSDGKGCLVRFVYGPGYTKRQPDGHRLLRNFFSCVDRYHDSDWEWALDVEPAQ